jgi:membrane protein
MIRKLWQIAYEAGAGFFNNRLPTSAAAMAFYTMFALGPILIFIIALAEPFVGRLMAQQAVFDALGTIVDPKHLKTIQRFASEDLFKGSGIAAIVGGVVLIFSGSRVFVELDDSFEVIWRGHRPTRVHPIMATVKSRLLALLLMVLLGVLMIVVIMSSVVLSAYAHVLTSFPVLGEWIGPAISGFTHYGILTIFFTLLYKWLPTGGVPWRFALVSGAVNSLLFAVGNRALVYYFEVTNLTSAFGATAGFAAIMVWMYWTSLTILVGAQVGRAARDAFVDGEPRPEAAKANAGGRH